MRSKNHVRNNDVTASSFPDVKFSLGTRIITYFTYHSCKVLISMSERAEKGLVRLLVWPISVLPAKLDRRLPYR